MQDIRLALITGVDIPIPECQLILHQPKLKEIALLGEKDFFTGIQCLNINKSLYGDKDESLLQNTTNFQIFMTAMLDKRVQDKKVNVEYGLVCKLNDIEIIKNGLIKPISEFYYAPISTYYARLYLLSNDEYVIKYIKKKLSNSFDFYKKHFCFYVLYIYILNININDVLSYNSLGAYLSILRQINFFLEEFKNFYR